MDTRWEEFEPPFVVDAHTHIFSMGRYSHPAALMDLANRAGIDIICCSPFAAIKYEMETGNDQVREAARLQPGRIFGYANVPSADLWPEANAEITRRIAHEGFRGIGEIITYTYSDLTDAGGENWISLYRKAAELGVPILAHQRTRVLEEIAEAVPNAVIIMAHMGNGDREGNWREAIRAARRHPNLYLETCSSTVDMGLIEDAVEQVGAERILFGSDLPLLNPHVQIAKITGARVDRTSKRKILGENMARLLRLTQEDLRVARQARVSNSQDRARTSTGGV